MEAQFEESEKLEVILKNVKNLSFDKK